MTKYLKNIISKGSKINLVSGFSPCLSSSVALGLQTCRMLRQMFIAEESDYVMVAWKEKKEGGKERGRKGERVPEYNPESTLNGLFTSPLPRSQVSPTC